MMAPVIGSGNGLHDGRGIETETVQAPPRVDVLPLPLAVLLMLHQAPALLRLLTRIWRPR